VTNPYLLDWLNLLLRWGHLIAGIAWIGTSFYFVALDFSLRKSADLPRGVAGEAWEVHGGGFYHVRKYLSAPDHLPGDLIWFKWEAYLTWFTGFFLLIAHYYVDANSSLIDPAVLMLTAWQAVGISLVSLAFGWLVYDGLCRTLAITHPTLLAGLVFLFIVLAAYGFTHVFSGRGAFIHVGALVGTLMAANVFLVIIPNQRRITTALLRGEMADPRLGAVGKQRSLHNTYLTLPVLAMMISNHYSMLTDHPHAWILVGLIVVGGAATRHFLVRHEVGDPLAKIAWTLPIILVALAIAYGMTWTGPVNQDWLNFILRWGHMIAGIAWIGTSFYFVALDFSLKNPGGLSPGVAGEAWEVHGGGFYHVQKYLRAPKHLPGDLIWFKWEAYLTWVSGFLLLILLYYVNAEIYLIDPAVRTLLPWQAIGLSVVSLASGWVIYDQLCRSLTSRNTALLASLVFLLIVAAAYMYAHVFSGRGALIHVGALIGTIMAANVFMVIIPNQRKITGALIAGEIPDARFGNMGKQRSLHNTYLTLPVLLMMVSSHYPMITDNDRSWLLVGFIMFGGAALRHFLVRTEVGDAHRDIAWTLPVIGGMFAIALMLTEPAPRLHYEGEVTDAEALGIVTNRCVACHAKSPSDRTTHVAPKGIMLETLADLKRHARKIEVQAVNSKAMPLGNKTKMLDEERLKLGAWIGKQ
jgi:uncharacterized membrane protein